MSNRIVNQQFLYIVKSENEKMRELKKNYSFSFVFDTQHKSYNFVDFKRKEVVKNNIDTTSNYLDYFNSMYFHHDKIFNSVRF